MPYISLQKVILVGLTVTLIGASVIGTFGAAGRLASAEAGSSQASRTSVEERLSNRNSLRENGPRERGLPFPNKHFAPPSYGQNPQNWAIAQDEKGLTYVANNDGVMQYDGERWRLITTTTGTLVRSLATDSLVFVGAKGDFGYLQADSLGTLRYRSLYDHIPDGKRDFGDVWKTHVLSDGAYYQTSKHVFRWDGEEITSWTSEETFHTSFTVGNDLYVRSATRGLLRMEGDSLVLAKGGDAFSEMSIHMMVPHPSGDILIGTENEGLYLYDGQEARSFAPHLTPYFEENDLYHGCKMAGERYALATLGGGVIIIGADGEALRVLDKSLGLPDDVVNYVYSGRSGGLWMALNNDGVYWADVSSPTTIHGEDTGLNGVIRSVNRHNGHLHVATGSGLYVLRKSEGQRSGRGQILEKENPRFEKWDGLPSIWDLLSIRDGQLAATPNGILRINSPRTFKVTDGNTYDLIRSESKDVVYAGTRSGVKVLRRIEGNWEPVSVEGIEEEVRSLATGTDGSLWAGTVKGEIIRAKLSADYRHAKEIVRYGQEDGLPEGYKVPMTVGGNITVRSKNGVFQIENKGQKPGEWRFDPRPSLLPDVASAGTANSKDTLAIKSFLEDDRGTLWVGVGSQVFKGHRRTEADSEEVSYAWSSVRPLHFPKPDGIGFYVEADSTVWLTTGEDLIRYAPRLGRFPLRRGRQTGQRIEEGQELSRREQKQEGREVPFRALVRQVTTLSGREVVFGGTVGSLGPDSSLALPYKSNDLRIDVAAPLYGRFKPHQYQYKLIGHSDEWSNWKRRAYVTYTNLWEGTYRIQVRARSDRGEISEAGTLTLHIRPPWYRSQWAYLIYGIGTILFVLGLRHYYRVRKERKRAKKQTQKLKREREAKKQLERANERLRETNRLKEEFLANTSHELRTPLTNILGFTDVLRESATEEQEHFLDALEKNGKRLKRTLKALLDLSRLRSGDEEIELEAVSVHRCVERVVSQLRRDAEDKGLSLEVKLPKEPVYAEANENYLEQILRNLVENAVKYTHEGSVVVIVEAAGEDVKVAVDDTGIGIDESFLPHLFEDFKQESRGKARSYEGYGLGLAISSRLVKLMGGSINVESTKGEGSTFTLTLSRIPSSTEFVSDTKSSQNGQA